jgi:hypothetical protein
MALDLEHVLVVAAQLAQRFGEVVEVVAVRPAGPAERAMWAAISCSEAAPRKAVLSGVAM